MAEITPIIDGAIQHSCARMVPVGAADLDTLLSVQLSRSNPGLHLDENLARNVREALCSVPREEGAALGADEEAAVEHTLPDGQVSPALLGTSELHW
jgi:hypothetical protein